MIKLLAVGVAVVALSSASVPVSAQTFSTPALWEYTSTTPVAAPAPQPYSTSALLRPAKSYGPSGSPASNGNGASDTLEFGESEKGSLGCLIGGVAGTAGALLIGGENIINLIAGGMVIPASPAALYASMFGVVFASFCAVGQAMTPAIVYAYRRYFEDGEFALPQSAPPEPPRNPPLMGRFQKTVFDPAGPDQPLYVR